MLSREQWLEVLEHGLERIDGQDICLVEVTHGYRVPPGVPVLRVPCRDRGRRGPDDETGGRDRRAAVENAVLHPLKTITVAFEAVTQHPGGLPYLERAQGACIVADHPTLVLVSTEHNAYIPWEAIVFIEA